MYLTTTCGSISTVYLFPNVNIKNPFVHNNKIVVVAHAVGYVFSVNIDATYIIPTLSITLNAGLILYELCYSETPRICAHFLKGMPSSWYRQGCSSGYRRPARGTEGPLHIDR